MTVREVLEIVAGTMIVLFTILDRIERRAEKKAQSKRDWVRDKIAYGLSHLLKGKDEPREDSDERIGHEGDDEVRVTDGNWRESSQDRLGHLGSLGEGLSHGGIDDVDPRMR